MSFKKLLLSTVFFISLIVFGGYSPTYGQANQVSVPGLRVEPDPASTGRGFTGVATAQDANAVYWNPALLANQSGIQVGLSRFKWLPDLDPDLNYNYIMGRYPVEDIGMVGAHITYLDLGSQDFRDDQGNSSGSFSSYEFSIGVSVGRVAVPEKLSLGLGVRFISSRLTPSGVTVGGSQTQTGNSFGVDIGAHYTPNDFSLLGKNVDPTAGVAITNFGGRVQYSDSGFKNSIPTLFRLGGGLKISLDEADINVIKPSVEMSKFLVRSDSTGAENPFKSLFTSWGSYDYFNGQSYESVPLGKQLMWGWGFEYWYNDMLGLRSGYYSQSKDNGGRKFLTLGAGLKYSMFQVDLSYAIPKRNKEIGNIFRIGATVNL